MTKRLSPFRLGISTKLTLLLVLLVLAMLVLMLVNINLFGQHIERVVQIHALRVSEVVERAMSQRMFEDHLEGMREIVDNIGLEAEIVAIRIYDADGQIRISTDTTEESKALPKTAPQCTPCHTHTPPLATLDLDHSVRQFTVKDGSRVLALINPINSTPACVRCHAHSPDQKVLGLIEIERSLHQADYSTRETRLAAVTYSVIVILLTGLLLVFTLNRMIRKPIRRLIEGTERIAMMDLDHRIPEASNDELGQLSRSFNEMTEELNRAQEANRQWSATLEERVKEKTHELEEAQAHLILVDKMASLGKLAGVVAHEINNPLAGILTYAKLSIRNLSHFPEDRKIIDTVENLMVISDEAKRCGNIVNSLLHFSKRTYGQMSDTDVVPLVERAMELARHAADKSNTTVALENLSGNSAIHCDPAAIEQMLLVFLMNAIEAMPAEGGEVLVTLRDDSADSLTLEISDTGRGIAEQDIAHIFEPYFTTKESGKNTGLGLAVAYKIIVEQHAGRVSVFSEIGKGTRFTIDLSRSTQSPPPSEAAAAT